MFFTLSNMGSKDKTHIVFLKPMTVLTGSMSPSINPGDIIIDKKIDAKAIKEGDIITFRASSNVLITHRIVEVISKDGEISFKTKGDANNSEDEKLVDEEQVVGGYIFKIPYAGYISKLTGNIFGFILIIFIPACVLILIQIKDTISQSKMKS